MRQRIDIPWILIVQGLRAKETTSFFVVETPAALVFEADGAAKIMPVADALLHREDDAVTRLGAAKFDLR